MIIILGAKGQLARAFQEILEPKTYLALDRQSCDIGNYSTLKSLFEQYRPKVVINCAAYNLVDDCELNSIDSLRINSIGPAYLADLSSQFGSFLIHFSTDYVFDGSKCGLYLESDEPNPLNEYGKSKLLGEKLVSQTAKDYLIFRTSWVYGNGRNNFITKLLNWCRVSEFLRIACDEFSVPTSVYTLAQTALISLNKGLNGLFHLVNTGYCSRLEWSEFVLEQLDLKKFIYPAKREFFNLKAQRPFFSAMSNQFIARNLGIEIQDWQMALKEFLKDYHETEN